MKDMLTIMTSIEKCIAQLDAACKELEEVGVTYSSVCVYYHNDIIPHMIYLSRGITELATAFDKKVESEPTDSFGRVKIGDISFMQSKLPVEREDRYA